MAESCCGVVCIDNEVLGKTIFLEACMPSCVMKFLVFFPILCILTACLPFDVRVSVTILYLVTYCRWIFAIIFD